MRRAFTLIEMLVVVGLITVLITVAVPAFSGMLYSSNRALAENGLRVASTLARDASYASLTGGDGVAVYSTDALGRTTIVAGEILGSFEDQDVVAGGGVIFDAAGNPVGEASTNERVRRDLAAPVAFAETITLPEFFSVRGYAPPASLTDGWYTDSEAYSSQNAFDDGNWVGVETNYYDREEQFSRGSPRRTFMIRYSSSTGKGVGTGAPTLLVDPRPDDEERDMYAANRSDVDDAWKRVDWASDLSAWTRQALGRVGTDVNNDGMVQFASGQTTVAPDADQFYELVGNRSHDTVLAGAVSRVALFDERRLSTGIGGRGINPTTGTIYQPWNDDDGISFDVSTGDDPGSLFETGLDAYDIRERINSWINGDTDRDDDFDEDDRPEARIFLVSRYTGELTEAER